MHVFSSSLYNSSAKFCAIFSGKFRHLFFTFTFTFTLSLLPRGSRGVNKTKNLSTKLYCRIRCQIYLNLYLARFPFFYSCFFFAVDFLLPKFTRFIQSSHNTKFHCFFSTQFNPSKQPCATLPLKVDFFLF